MNAPIFKRLFFLIIFLSTQQSIYGTRHRPQKARLQNKENHGFKNESANFSKHSTRLCAKRKFEKQLKKEIDVLTIKEIDVFTVKEKKKIEKKVDVFTIEQEIKPQTSRPTIKNLDDRLKRSILK